MPSIQSRFNKQCLCSNMAQSSSGIVAFQCDLSLSSGPLFEGQGKKERPSIPFQVQNSIRLENHHDLSWSHFLPRAIPISWRKLQSRVAKQLSFSQFAYPLSVQPKQPYLLPSLPFHTGEVRCWGNRMRIRQSQGDFSELQRSAYHNSLRFLGGNLSRYMRRGRNLPS